jgi:hypothetical protein
MPLTLTRTLSLSFAVCVAASGCASAPPLPEGADEVRRAPEPLAHPSDASLFGLVPAGPRLVIDLNLAEVRTSGWTASLLDVGDAIARANRRAALGYDDAADIDRILYAATVLDASRPTLVIAQGRFQAQLVEEAFRARWAGSTIRLERGIAVNVSGENALAFVTPRTFLSGAPADVQVAIDRAFGVGTALEADPGLGPLWRALSTAVTGAAGDPAVRAVVVLDRDVRTRVGAVWAVPATVTHLGLRLDLGRALDLGGIALTADRSAAEAVARTWATAARGPQVRLLASAIGLGPLLGGLAIGAEGARVHVSTTIDENQRPEINQALRTLVQQIRGS